MRDAGNGRDQCAAMKANDGGMYYSSTGTCDIASLMASRQDVDSAKVSSSDEEDCDDKEELELSNLCDTSVVCGEYYDSSNIVDRKDTHIAPLIVSNVRELLKLSLPIACTALFTRTLTATDLVIIGHFLNREAVAGVALGNTLYNMFYFFIIGSGTAITTLCSQSYGAGMYEDVLLWAQRGFLLLMCFAVPVTILLGCLPEFLLVTVMRQDANIAKIAALYVRLILPGLPAAIAFDVLVIFLQSQSCIMPYLYISIIVSISNVFSDLLLVSNIGLVGAPLATTLCRYLSLFLMIVYIKVIRNSKQSGLGWQWRKILNPSCWTLLKMASWGGLMLSFEALSFEISTIFVGMLSDDVSLNAHFIMLNFIGMMYQIFPLSIANACNVRIGNLIGSGLKRSTQITAYMSILLGGVSMLISSSICLFKRSAIGEMYSKDGEVIEIVSQLSSIAAIFQVADGIQCGAMGALRGLGKQHISAIISSFGFSFVGLLHGYFFCFMLNYGLLGIWIGFSIGIITAALLSCVVIKFTDWNSTVIECATAASKDMQTELIETTERLPTKYYLLQDDDNEFN